MNRSAPRRPRRARRKTLSHWIDLPSTVRRYHSNNHRLFASCSSCSSCPSCLINHLAGESQFGIGHLGSPNSMKRSAPRRPRRARRKPPSHWIDLSSTVRRYHSTNQRLFASCSSCPSCLINHLAGESQFGIGHLGSPNSMKRSAPRRPRRTRRKTPSHWIDLPSTVRR